MMTRVADQDDDHAYAHADDMMMTLTTMMMMMMMMTTMMCVPGNDHGKLRIFNAFW